MIHFGANTMKDLQKAIEGLSKSMEAEYDMREQCRDSDHFINKKDGQWEPEIITRMRGRPRYTFDKVNPIIDQIVGEIRSNDFTLRVSPAGDSATKKVSQVYDGLIRNIRNLSNAELIFDNCAEQMVGIGMSAFEVVNDYVDSDCFDQDLLIKPIHDAHNRVYFEPNSKMPDRSDARWCVVLEEVTKEEYEKEFPDGSGMSISKDQDTSAYYFKPDSVTIGRFLYKKSQSATIVKMSDGSVYEVDEDFKSIVDELFAAGITEVARRQRKIDRVYQRYADGQKWLDKEEETVFRMLPVVPMYANFRLSDGKIIYRGITQMLMDSQRVYNYARSREVEEGALAPRAKYWMSPEQAKGHVEKLRTLNTNADPVQLFNPDPMNPGAPQQQGGAAINPGLSNIAAAMRNDINETGGMFGASMGDNPGLQSGVAINSQIDRGNNGTIKYFAAIEVALNCLGKILIDAIPRVYDSTRQIRVIGDDGSSDTVFINRSIIDEQTGQLVTINDLSQGKYDVTCDIGAAFKNRQDEANEAFTAMANVFPEVAQMGMDIWLSNINAPGMDKLAERARMIALQNGLIPQEQMTDEELAQAKSAQQQPQEPDANMVLAQAEQMKAEADVMAQQNKQAEIQLKAEELQLKMADVQAKYQGQTEKLQSETALNMAKVEQGQQSLDLKAQQVQAQQQLDMMKLILEQQKAQADEVAKLASALNNMRSAMGADVVINNSTVEAYDDISKKIGEQNGM